MIAISIWRAWSSFWGVAVIALCLGYGLVSALSRDNPVSNHTLLKVATPRIVVGGTLEYTIVADRQRPCKGYISETFTSIPTGDELFVQVVSHRPLQTTQPQKRKIETFTPSPNNIKGRANYVAELVSQCPEGERRDLIARFDYEAVAP